MSTLEDPLISSHELGTQVPRRTLAALVAVLLLLGLQPSSAVQAEVSLPTTGFAEVKSHKEGFLEKPLIVETKITPPPPLKPKKVTGIIRGNGYANGYCTAYVALQRPDLPRNLGNAKTWIQRATVQGLPTGQEPRVGAVVQTSESQYGHVAYVTSVGDGYITVSEANYEGWNRISSRTISINASIIKGYIY